MIIDFKFKYYIYYFPNSKNTLLVNFSYDILLQKIYILTIVTSNFYNILKQ